MTRLKHADIAAHSLPKFGRELVLDLYGCDGKPLVSADDLRLYVAQLVEKIDMKAFGPIEIQHFGHGNPITSGYSVKQWIETSLISLHLSPYLASAHINIFSCKDFDHELAIEFSEQFFRAEVTVFSWLTR